MQIATREYLKSLDELAARRREEIRNTKDEVTVRGTTYYVSADGCDEADGLTPETAWQTLARVSNAALSEGDAVRFRRGDVFRGKVICKSAITYCAYGEGEKPRIYSWKKDLADPALWELYDEERCIWHLRELITETGNLIFDHGREHAYKHIPSYIADGSLVVRDHRERPFVIRDELTHDLDFFCNYVEDNFTTTPSKGEDFPIPMFYGTEALCDLYLRSNRGNPGLVFDSIEAAVRECAFVVSRAHHVHIDNICCLYQGIHAVTAGGERHTGLHVTNCEMGWIGGTVQGYSGTDPNHPEGVRGEVTRFGNAVEIYGGCEDYVVENCYVYQCYDAGLSHQVNSVDTRIMTNILYKDNLIEHCVYGIEYFLDIKDPNERDSIMDGVEMCGNFIRHSGEGWGQQRHNTHTPAAIKGWSYRNTAKSYTIHHNILDRAGRRMVHLVADEQASCPAMWENTYIQYDGGCLGQYGGKENGEPEIHRFTDDAERVITEVFGERDPKVYIIK